MSCFDDIPNEYKCRGQIEKVYITNIDKPFSDLNNVEEWQRRVSLPDEDPEKIIALKIDECKPNNEEIKHIVNFNIKKP